MTDLRDFILPKFLNPPKRRPPVPACPPTGRELQAVDTFVKLGFHSHRLARLRAIQRADK